MTVELDQRTKKRPPAKKKRTLVGSPSSSQIFRFRSKIAQRFHNKKPSLPHLVALLVTVVLGDEVEVLATDDDGALHLGGDDLTSEDAATDGDITGEGALLVDVVALNGLLGGLETKTDLLVPAVVLDRLLAGNLGVLEDTLLLLESFLNLVVGLCRVCG